MFENLLGKKEASQAGVQKGTAFNWTKTLGWVVVALIIAGALVYGGFYLKREVDRVRTNWAEIQFANDPATHGIVKQAREKYVTRVASVASEIVVTDEKKPADRLVETVISQIEGSKK